MQNDKLKNTTLRIHNILLEEYGKPEWRNSLSPIDELVSTILSQNTNDTNRDVAYFALKAKYPSWEQVVHATSEEIASIIRPAGLANQKAPRIIDALNDIRASMGGLTLEPLRKYSTEDARDYLLSLKGVGPKTAAIVLLFSLDKPAFPVDTHIYRISGRLGIRSQKMSVENTHKHLESIFPPEAYYDVHLNFLRLGREICRARKPQCDVCPLIEICPYPQSNTINGVKD